MKRMKRTFTLLLVFTLTAAAGTAFAATTRARPKRPRPAIEKVLRCLQIVDLSDAQKTSIRGIFDSVQPTLASLADTLHADQATLQSLLDADSPDACAIGSAALTVHQDADALRAEMQVTMDAINGVLTAEQQLMLSGCLHAPQASTTTSE